MIGRIPSLNDGPRGAVCSTTFHQTSNGAVARISPKILMDLSSTASTCFTLAAAAFKLGIEIKAVYVTLPRS